MSHRRIVMFNWLTANGCFADANGKLDWVVPDDEQVKFSVAAIPNFDTVMFGRRTYELFDGFWRFAAEDSDTAPDPHRPGRRTREHKAIAVWLNGMTKLVFSRSAQEAKWEKPASFPCSILRKSRRSKSSRARTSFSWEAARLCHSSRSMA